jgi:hypothetical protein
MARRALVRIITDGWTRRQLHIKKRENGRKRRKRRRKTTTKEDEDKGGAEGLKKEGKEEGELLGGNCEKEESEDLRIYSNYIYTCARTHTNIYMYIFIYINMHYICMYICIYINMHICLHM